MHKTQLIQFLKIIKESELKAFKVFLRERLLKTEKVEVSLFDYIIKFAPNYESPKLNRVTVLKKVFKAQPISNGRLNKAAFQIKNLLEEFLIAYEITQDTTLKNKLLLLALEKRNHPDFSKTSRKLIAEISNTDKKILVADDYLDLFQINYALWSNVNTKKIDSNLEVLRMADTHLDVFFLLKKVKIILEEKNSKGIIVENKSFGKAIDITFLLQQQPTLAQQPTIQLFLKAIRMMESAEIVDYQSVKKALFTTISKLSKKDAQDILVTLTNFYNKHSGKNPSFWKKEAFDLYAFADNNKLLIDNGRMRYVEYCNGAMAGIITQNFDWSATFMQTNKAFLASEIQDLVYAYIQAFYYFQKQDFNRVIQLLKSIDLMDSSMLNLDINIRTLNLRTFFERWIANNYLPSEEHSSIIYQIANFEGYITRHKKLSSFKKHNYQQFALFFRALVNTIENKTPQIDKLKTLENHLASMSSLALREWLQRTVKRLIANVLDQ